MDFMGRDFTPTVRHDVYPSIQPMPGTLPSNCTVCIVGASRDIGAHIAYAFAHAGAAAIAVCSLTAEEVNASQIPAKVAALNPSIQIINLVCDVTLESDVESFAKTVTSTLGRLDVLVCNAGFFGGAPDEPTSDEFSRSFDVNCKGVYLATKHLVPLLLSSPEGLKVVVSTCSMGMHSIGNGANMGYCLSKLAQARFIERLAFKYPDIIAVAIHPGAVKTEMAKIAPKHIYDALPDSPDLAGGFVVWLAREKRMWLSGRYLSANWDVDELCAKKEEIMKSDKLKMRMIV